MRHGKLFQLNFGNDHNKPIDENRKFRFNIGGALTFPTDIKRRRR